ncbi:MAG: hypothetical protein NTY48_02880 [Candidatus Diapherotrites archaeon]|nr:hypothetical protein [Candidatus Diapherotrites archaeon]
MGMFDFLKGKNDSKHAEKELKFAVKESLLKKNVSLEEKEAQIKHKHLTAHREKIDMHKYNNEAKKQVQVQRSIKNNLGICIPEHAKSRTDDLPLLRGVNAGAGNNVCIPIHAKSAEERRKLKKEDLSPFEKIRENYEKSEKEFDQEFEEITSQTPEEPYDYDPSLGVETLSEEHTEKKPVLKTSSIDPVLAERKARMFEEVRKVMYRGGTPPSEKPKQKPINRKEFKMAFDVPLEEEKEETKKSENGFWEIGAKNKERKTGFKEREMDEIDESIDKIEGYVPKFSSTARAKLGIAKEEKAAPSVYGTFRVSGVYPGGDTTVISGEVVFGKITQRLTAQNGNAIIRVSELKRGMETVSELYTGEIGTIFTRGSALMVRNGDELEFS